MKSFRQFYLFTQVFVALLQAWDIKTRRDLSYVRFQSPDKFKSITTDDIDYLIKCTDSLVRYGAIRTGRKCFFRAYMLGSVLRKWGLPVTMNVGLIDLGGDCKRHGHCWLTLNGCLLAESADEVKIYKTELGSRGNDICYWYGGQQIGPSDKLVG